MANAEMVQRWNQEAAKIQGRTIKKAEYIVDEEFGHMLAIVLDDDSVLFPMRDDEGNGPGSIHIQGIPELTCLPTL